MSDGWAVQYLETHDHLPNRWVEHRRFEYPAAAEAYLAVMEELDLVRAHNSRIVRVELVVEILEKD